jgi:hypothetical protein
MIRQMTEYQWDEVLVEQEVTYVLEIAGRLLVVENVPARVNVATGERLFAPETVAKLQQIAFAPHAPKRMMQTPVYEFSAA